MCVYHCIGTSRRMPACSWLSPHGRPRMYFECSWSTAAVLACPVYTICCRGITLVHALLRSYLPLMAEHCACVRACARVLLLVRVRARGWVGGWGCVCTRSGGGCCRLVRHSLADWPSMQLTDPWSSCCPVVHCWPSLAAACTLVLLSGRSYWDSTCQTQYPCCVGFAHSSLAVSSVCGLATPGRSSRPRIVELRSALVWPCIGTPFTHTHCSFATVIFEVADNLLGRQQQNDGFGLDWGLIDSIESLCSTATEAVAAAAAHLRKSAPGGQADQPPTAAPSGAAARGRSKERSSGSGGQPAAAERPVRQQRATAGRAATAATFDAAATTDATVAAQQTAAATERRAAAAGRRTAAAAAQRTTG